jgi:hypothetical protein
VRAFYISTSGRIVIPFGEMVAPKNAHPSFKPEVVRRELLSRLNSIPGIETPDDKIELFPSFLITLLGDAEQRERFYGVMEWAFEEMRAYTARVVAASSEQATAGDTNLTHKQRERP